MTAHCPACDLEHDVKQPIPLPCRVCHWCELWRWGTMCLPGNGRQCGDREWLYTGPTDTCAKWTQREGWTVNERAGTVNERAG